MKIAVAIPNHDQHHQVLHTIEILSRQSLEPDTIYVMSDGKPLYTENEKVIQILNGKKHGGRCSNRNSVIEPFLESDNDILIFMDGDCCPDDNQFIEKYAGLMRFHELVFGTRRHTPVDDIETPASDLLTANMDNLWKHQPIDYTDLRVVSGAVTAWQTAVSFNERLDLMLTGMIGWSCNFAFTKKGLRKLCSFMLKHYGLENQIFDSDAFKDGWGYEDVAMGIDALYAGLDIWIDDSVKVSHLSHERSDGLFDHVKGRHIIMERYRDIQAESDLFYYGPVYLLMLIAFFLIGIATGYFGGYLAP